MTDQPGRSDGRHSSLLIAAVVLSQLALFEFPDGNDEKPITQHVPPTSTNYVVVRGRIVLDNDGSIGNNDVAVNQSLEDRLSDTNGGLFLVVCESHSSGSDPSADDPAHVLMSMDPRHFVVREGQPLLFRCDGGNDRSAHHVHGHSKLFANLAALNQLVSQYKSSKAVRLTEAELGIEVRCDIHPKNYCYITVVSSTLWTWADREGRFQIIVPSKLRAIKILAYHPTRGFASGVAVINEQLSIDLLLEISEDRAP